MFSYKKNQTASPLVFLMISSVDHISPALGVSPVVTLSKNGGSFSAAAGVVSEIGNGWYKVAPVAADFNTEGPLALHATAATADPTDAQFGVGSGLVQLGPTQITDIVGNIQGSVNSVVNPVTCKTLRGKGC